MTPTDIIIASLPHKSQAERARIRTNAERWVKSGTPAQKAEGKKMIAALDALGEAEAKTLYDRLSGMTVAKRVVEAFRKQPPTETEVTVILALLNYPGSTSTGLSKACGWKAQIWHTHFGTMCKKREADLWPAEPFTKRDANFYSGILADLDPNGNRFTMKPEVADAFAELGLLARSGGPA